MLTVVCFDLDDTLISECDYVEGGLRAAAALVAAEAGAPEEDGEWLVEAWRRERARDAFQRLLARHGLDEARWLPRLRSAYRDHAPCVRPRDGAVELLARLVARGDRLALVTDGWLEVQRRKWQALGLPHPFSPIVFTDELGRAYWKPHPRAFELVMRHHPRADRFVYVADNLAKDFVAPNALGWATVLVRDPRNLHAAAAPPPGGEPAVEAPDLGHVAKVLGVT